MSNSQPCHAQRSISPTRLRLKLPGSSDLRWATQAAFANGAPACGQRLSKAKNSTIDMKYNDLATLDLTTLLPPAWDLGGVSDDMAGHRVSRVVDGARIGIEDLRPARGRSAGS